MATFDEAFDNEDVTVQLIRLILDMPYENQASLLMQLTGKPLIPLETKERDEQRKAFTSGVSFAVQGIEYTGVSEDISSGGMFIKTDASFSLGEIMVLKILSTNRKKQVKIPAEIVRIKEDGIGVRFMKKTD